MTEDKNGFILRIVTTADNVQETTNLGDVLDTCPLTKGTIIKADKGYKSKMNDKLLAKLNLRNHIMYKAKKNQPITANQKKQQIGSQNKI